MKAGLAGALVLVGCSSGADSRSTGAWSPDTAGDGTGGTMGDDDADGGPGGPGGPEEGGNVEEGEGGNEEAGQDEGPGGCVPGESAPCLCDDGLHLGDEVCNEDGQWGACLPCEEPTNDEAGDDDDDDMAESSGDGGNEMPTEVCYPGADNSFTTCFNLHYFEPDAMPTGYDYPGQLGDDVNYRNPIAFIDLEENAEGTSLAPNFVLSEIAQLVKGRWAIVQPHAVVSLQGLRDQVGAINVNSGYRSPAYNAGVDGATYSRHMYGDGFDLDPVSVSLTELENACTSDGGMLVEYTTHVHCDFRFDAVDEEFFGPVPMGIDLGAEISLSAELVEDDDGVWTAPAFGFDEGEPRRRWQAFDASGELIATGVGATFRPPAQARSMIVRIGRAIDVATDL